MTEPPQATVVAAVRNGVTVVSVAGEVDLANADDVRVQITDAAEGRDGLVVDLTELAYFDSSGIRMVYELSRRFSRFALVAAGGSPAQVTFNLTNLDRALPIVGTVDEGLALMD